MHEPALHATNRYLIIFLKPIPDSQMRSGIPIPAWYLLLVAVQGILIASQGLRDLHQFNIRHHSVLTEVLGQKLRRPPSDSAFRFFFRQVDLQVSGLPSAMGRTPRSRVDQRISNTCWDGKTLRGSIEPKPVAVRCLTSLALLRRSRRGDQLDLLRQRREPRAGGAPKAVT